MNRPRSPILNYALALLVTAAAALLNLALRKWLAPNVSPLFLAGVMGAAWIGGLGPGLVAAVASTVAITWFFQVPAGSFEGLLRTMVFLGTAGFISSLVDARRRAEAAEHLRRVWYEAMLTSVGDGVIATDAEGRVSFLNTTAEELTGWTRDEARDQPIDAVFPVRDESTDRRAEGLAARALRERTGVGPDRPTVLVDRSGRRRPIDGRAAPIRQTDGSTIGVVIVFHDASDRRRADEAMSELAAIVASSQDAIISKGLDELITSWNPGAERLFGYPAEEAIGRPLTMLLPPDCTDEMPRMLTRIENGVPISHYETERLRKDGHRLDISVSISPLRDPEGKIVGTSTIARDVTERRQAERRLAAQYAVSRILAESANLGQAMPRLLEAVGTALRWEFGAYWTIDPGSGRLKTSAVWYVGGEKFAEFARFCAAASHARGEGLPGRAWSSGEPVWITGNAEDGHYSRAGLVMLGGMHIGLAFPIATSEGDTLGVVEFFGIERQPPDDALMGMLRVVGTQIGQFVERRRAEAELKLAETRFRRLSESGILGIILADVTERTKIQDANDTFLAMVGATRDDLAAGGLDWDAMTPPEYRAIDARAVAQLRATGVCDAFVKEYAGLHGRRVSVLIGAARLDEASGLCIAFLIDVTERRRAEEALLHREEQLRLALDVARMGSWDWNIVTGAVEWSENLEAIHGIPPGEFVGTLEAFAELVHPDDRSLLRDALDGALAGVADYEVEFRILPPGGSMLWMSGRGRVFRDPSGAPIRMIGVGLDITERKRAEHDVHDAKEAAVNANLAKDQFLAVLSHELRTPLTPVLAAVSAMIDEPSTPDEFRSVLSMVRRNINLEARLIDDLLDVTKISTGKLQLTTEVVDARELIYQALEICVGDLRDKGIRLELGLNAPAHHVLADPARLQQVFWNLIKNAVKFTPSGGLLSIKSRDDDEGRFVVEVSDTGQGIEPEHLPKIFNAFEQGDSSITRRFGGLGLGLAISRSVVELLGGSLTAWSAGLDQGSTFTIALASATPPADRAKADGDGEVEGDGTRGAAEPPLASAGPLRVLLVEDNDDSLRVLAKLLRRRGHEVATATSVASAAALGGSQAFDLLISDLGLPDGSGLDVIRHLRERGPIAAIALSGYGMESDLRKSRDAGFAAHLVKPIDIQGLEAAIAAVAGRPSEAAR